MRKTLAVLLLLLAPSFLVVSLPNHALAAGFANQSIFLSKTPVTEGDKVRVYAVVSNPGAASFKGTVDISDGSDKLGSVPLTLAAGGAQTVSVPWAPIAGAHTVKAALMDSGTEAAEAQQTFTVVEKPKPVVVATPVPTTSNQSASAVESSAGIQQSIESISPVAGNVAKPVFSTLDGVREAIANVADQQLNNVKPKISQGQSKGQVEGISTEAAQPWYFAILYTVYFYILTLVRFVVGSAGVFYPVLAVLFLYFMWKMFRRFRRA